MTTPPYGQGASPTLPELHIALRSGATCDLRDGALASAAMVLPISDLIWAGLVVDPQAPPPTPGAAPAPAVGVQARDGRHAAFAPADPPDAWRLIEAIFQARPDLRTPVPPAPGATPFMPPPPPPGYYAQPGYAPPGPYGAAYGPYGAYPPPMPAHDNEHVLAGIAHLSVFFGPIIVPLIIWLVSRTSSPYAAKQGKQAFFFHLIFTVLIVILVVAFEVVFFGAMIASSATISADPSTSPTSFFFAPFLSFFIFYGLIFALSIFQMVFGVIGAVKSFRGEQFHYPLLGRL